jgi:hypothetical protein
MKTGGVAVRLALSGKPLRGRKFRCDCKKADVELPGKVIRGSGDARFHEVKSLCEWRRRWNSFTKRAEEGKMRFSEYFEKRVELLVHKPKVSVERYSDTIVVKCKRCHRAYSVLVDVECSVVENDEPSLLYLFRNLGFKDDYALDVALERIAVKSGRFENCDHLKRYLTNVHESMLMVREHMSSIEQNLSGLIEKVASDNAKGFLEFIVKKLESETQSFVEDCERTLKAYLSDIADVITETKLSRLGIRGEIEVLVPPL